MAEKSKAEKEKGGGTKTGGEEKVMVIPLKNKARRSAKNMRMNRSVRTVREFLSRHMRTEPSNVRISQQLNESLWKGGLHNPPSRIKVKVSTDGEGNVFASLLDEKERTKKEKKSRFGLRERLRRKASETPSNEESARRREGAKEEKTAETKEKPTAEKKLEPPKEKPKKETKKKEGGESAFNQESEAPEELFEEDTK
jgi:large subunit ribosomal protein L31e